MALEDSNCGSFKHMTMQLCEAVITDNQKALADQINELVDRYESTKGPRSTGRRLAAFLPLLPALADAKHVSHDQAVHYFGTCSPLHEPEPGKRVHGIFFSFFSCVVSQFALK